MQKDELMERARSAMRDAYVPYSKFPVGAALLDSEGRLHTGFNIENAAFSLCNCAERTALFSAMAHGARTFQALAVAGETDGPCAPCGACRQVLAELCAPDMPVYLTNLKGDVQETTVSGLLPFAFTTEALNYAAN